MNCGLWSGLADWITTQCSSPEPARTYIFQSVLSSAGTEPCAFAEMYDPFRNVRKWSGAVRNGTYHALRAQATVPYEGIKRIGTAWDSSKQ